MSEETKTIEQAAESIRATLTMPHTLLREAAGGRAFDVTIIRAGKSLNSLRGKHLFYSEELLRASVDVFEGAPVRMIQLGEVFDHTPDGIDKDTLSGNIIGVLEGVHFSDGELRARLVLHEGASFAAGLLKLSVEMSGSGQDPLVGLSIDAMGSVSFQAHEGEEVAAVTELAGPASVDVVHRPAAGGAIRRLAASMNQGGSSQMDPNVKNQTPPAGETHNATATVTLTEEERKQIRESAVEEALAKLRTENEAREQAKNELREKITEAQKTLTTKLVESKLPEDVQALIEAEFKDSTFDVAVLESRIAAHRKVLAKRDTSGEVNVPFRAEVIRESRDKIDAALQYEFGKNGWFRDEARKALRESGADPLWSFQGFLQEAFGVDVRRDFARGKTLRESLTTSSWGEVFGDNLHKAMIRYAENPMFQSWREIATIETVGSYETQHRLRDYGYGNLPTVNEGQNYQALTSPGDDEETYAATKKGGTEDITEEMILADQLGRIAAIPMKLGTAAARTLYEAVWDNLTYAGQPTLGDSNALFYARTSPNGNTGTTALAAAQYIATRLLMMKYTDTATSKRLGVTPAYLAVPPDLEDEAYAMFKPLQDDPGGATTDRGFIVSTKPRIITVRHWTNAKDHVYIASPSEITGVIVGFVNGMEQPMLQIQDMQNVGSRFDADKITYKIKYPFGVGIGSYQAFYGHDVA